jgi:hypothetical protein
MAVDQSIAVLPVLACGKPTTNQQPICGAEPETAVSAKTFH